MKRKSTTTAKPQWAQAIQALRLRSRLNQAEFGARTGFSAMAVSRWERGAQEPPSHGYIALGNLARDESCWYFWERAGLRSEHILRVLPTIGKSIRASELEHVEIVNAGSGLRSRPEKIQLVAVPLLNAVAGAHGEKGDDVHMLNKAPIESMMAAPRDWCPNPSYTSCLRVRGNSMAPLILNGYIVAIDSSQINLSELDGKIVIAWHKDRGLTVSRFRRYDHTEVLVPENTGYDSVTITPKQPWKIVATVLWWIGKAP
jgi:SOS-response transcriptional repressor LexA